MYVWGPKFTQPCIKIEFPYQILRDPRHCRPNTRWHVALVNFSKSYVGSTIFLSPFYTLFCCSNRKTQEWLIIKNGAGRVPVGRGDVPCPVRNAFTVVPMGIWIFPLPFSFFRLPAFSNGHFDRCRAPGRPSAIARPCLCSRQRHGAAYCWCRGRRLEWFRFDSVGAVFPRAKRACHCFFGGLAVKVKWKRCWFNFILLHSVA